MENLNINDNVYIMFAFDTDDLIPKIYETVLLECNKKNISINEDIYIYNCKCKIKANDNILKLEFGINSKKIDDKATDVFCKITDENNNIVNKQILISFNKENIIIKYLHILTEIQNILEYKKIDLEKSIENINNQLKFIEDNNVDKLFIKC